MKTLKRILAGLCILATLLTTLCLPAAAASAVSSVNCQNGSNKSGGTSVYFYVKATGTTCKIKFTCGKGKLCWDGFGYQPDASVYGAYEVKIYKWDAKAKKTTGSCLFDKDIYNRSSYTASFSSQKNCYYRVQVYFWKATTTSTSYYKNKIVSKPVTSTSYDATGANYWGPAFWTTLPTIKATNGGNSVLYSAKP